MSFLFFRLPLLAAAEIVKSLDTMELLHFSVSSPKYTIPYTRSMRIHLTMSYRRLLKLVTFHFEANPAKKYNLHINEKSDPDCNYIWTLFKHRVSIVNCQSYFQSYWSNTDDVTALKLLICHFARSFKVQTNSFELHNGNFRGSVDILMYAKRLQLKFERVKWAPDNECTVEVERSVLEMCADVSELIFHSTALRGLSFDGFQNYKMNTLYIVDPYWLTTKNLCDMMGCRKVVLDGDSGQDIKLSLQMLKHFLKRWMDGGRLESLYVKGYGIPDMAQLLEGFNSRVIEADKQYEIRRADGTRAMLVGMDRLFRLQVVNE